MILSTVNVSRAGSALSNGKSSDQKIQDSLLNSKADQ